MSETSSRPADLAAHVEFLRALSRHPDESLRSLFDRDAPIYVARAPGRLDVMGGIADYSGSLVLQLPIREAVLAAVQQVAEPGAIVITLGDRADDVRRVVLSAPHWAELVASDYEVICRRLGEDADAAWAAYVLGPILVLLRETPAAIRGGLRILIRSHVPEGKGVSSSAALEVATMQAAAALVKHEIDDVEIARLCQLAENRVVGAPCGIMDQMTAALGRENELLALRCQPNVVEGFVAIPKGIAFWGIDSGIRHAVSGSDYTSVRVGAFMGYRMIAEMAKLHATPVTTFAGTVNVDDPKWRGYLSNISPAEFETQFADRLPEEISGREFLDRFSGTTDRVTQVDSARTYAVRKPTRHPIEENARVERFRELLQGELTQDSLAEMGDLMFASHASYSACGLGSDGTDLLVQLVRESGAAAGLYGAKITGGGSGGTVAVLGRAEAEESVAEISQQYSERTGRASYVFRGSSPGACASEVFTTRF
jgi:L-arabinokinase